MRSDVTFTSYDGTTLRGILNLPPNPRAALLMVHGIPSDKDEWGFYSDMAEFFAGHSIASLRFDFRGFGQSDPAPLSCLTLSAMIADIDAGFWELNRALTGLVPIHAVGTSCGGGVTLRWLNIWPRSVLKIHLMAPVLDYEFEVTGHRRGLLPEESLQIDRELIRRLNDSGTVNEEIGYGRAMLNEAHLFDGVTELAAAKCPIVIYQGSDDTVVPIAITRSIMEGAGSAELVVVAGADHGFAVQGDDNLTDLGTKANHDFVYREMLKRI
jgi:uncharacterized protein